MVKDQGSISKTHLRSAPSSYALRQRVRAWRRIYEIDPRLDGIDFSGAINQEYFFPCPLKLSSLPPRGPYPIGIPSSWPNYNQRLYSPVG